MLSSLLLKSNLIPCQAGLTNESSTCRLYVEVVNRIAVTERVDVKFSYCRRDSGRAARLRLISHITRSSSNTRPPRSVTIRLLIFATRAGS
jgi:hypothetical protein